MSRNSPEAPGRTAVVTASGEIHDRPSGSVVRHRRLSEYLRASAQLAGVGRLSFVWTGELDAGGPRGPRLRAHLIERARSGWDVELEVLDDGDVAALSSRELEVLTLLACGLTNPVIADRLLVARRTVATHVERILGKLGVSARAAAAAVAMDRHLLTLPLPGPVEDLAPIGLVRLEKAVRGTTHRIRRHSWPRGTRRRPLVIGAVYPTNSSAKADARSMERGAVLAIEEINERGGVGGQLLEHLVELADVTSAESVRAAVERLVERDVDAITAGYTFERSRTGFATQFGPAAAAGCPLLHHSTSASAARLVAEEPLTFGNVFQVCPPESAYGDGFVRTLENLRRSGAWRPTSRRLLVLDSTDPDLNTFPRGAAEAAERLGWQVTVAQVTELDSAWPSTAVTRIHAVAPAAVMIACFSATEMAQFLRLYDRSPTGTLLYALYTPSIPGFLEQVGAAADGLLWATVTGRYGDRLGDTFDRRFQTRFQAAPGLSSAGIHFDMVHLLAGAWARCDVSQDFRQANEQLRRSIHRGVNGVYLFDGPDQTCLSYPEHTADPSISQAHLVYRVQDGRHHVVAPAPHPMDACRNLQSTVTPEGRLTWSETSRYGSCARSPAI